MSTNHNKTDTLSFWGGLAMLVCGLYWFMSTVTVRTGFYSWRIGGFAVGGGLVVVPFIIGVILLFMDLKSFLGKLLTIGGLLIIIASVVMGTQLIFRATSLYNYLLMLVLAGGGAGLLLKALYGKKK